MSGKCDTVLPSRLRVVAAAVVVAGFLLSPAPGAQANEAGSGSVYWPFERHDVARTGFNAQESQLTPPLTPLWVVPDAMHGSARSGVLASEGFVLAYDGYTTYGLRATDGSTAWTHDDAEWPSAIYAGALVDYERVSFRDLAGA